MPINKWRYVEYLDDGVCAFQCLQCYETWTSREPPGYRRFDEITHPDGRTEYVRTDIYVPIWHYCPFCATKWDGTQREDSNELGPRRTRIAEAIKRRDDAKWNISYEQRRAEDIAREASRRYWLIEENYQFLFLSNPFNREGQWTEVRKLDRSTHSAKEALDLMRRHRELQLADHAEDIAEGRCAVEYRIRAV